MSVVLTDFISILPKYRVSQEKSIRLLAKVHSAQNPENFSRFEKLISRYGCGPDRIGSRYVEHQDLVNENLEERESFNWLRQPEGPPLSVRSKIFESIVDQKFKTFYLNESRAPEHIFHVSCTGYVSPSGGQKIVDQLRWQNQTTVSHLYHMGCYAAMPASRLALAEIQGRGAQRVDIVHTELCTLHLGSTNHSPEQLVVQSLFADGFIKYSAIPKHEFLKQNNPGLEVLGHTEVLIPGTTDKMSWCLSEHHFEMGLSREVPRVISQYIQGYFDQLYASVGLSFEQEYKRTIFAVHPGGPKIIDEVQAVLALNEDQVRHSKQVFFDRGNLSSATVPEIWKSVVNDSSIDKGLLIASVAFGPGLTISGSLARKV